MIRIFTIPFSEVQEIFFEDELNQFLLNKKIKTIRPEFFRKGEKAYRTIFVEFEPLIEHRENVEMRNLNEGDELLLKRLKEWRKIRANEEGIPVYIIAINSQLLSIVNNKPSTNERLKQIKGSGQKEDLKIWRCYLENCILL